MRVSELIEQLSKLPQDSRVAYYFYDDEYMTATYCSLQRLEHKEVEVVVGYDKEREENITEKELWAILYYKNDEEKTWGYTGKVWNSQ